MGDFSFWYSWGILLKKKVEKPHPQMSKRLDFRVGTNWLIFCWLKFGGCQLCVQLSWAFLHKFWKFLCPFCCKFPEFYDRPPTFQNGLKGCYWQKTKKLEFRKLPKLSQPWNLTILEDAIFKLFFSIICPRSTRRKIAQYVETFSYVCMFNTMNFAYYLYLSLSFTRCFRRPCI